MATWKLDPDPTEIGKNIKLRNLNALYLLHGGLGRNPTNPSIIVIALGDIFHKIPISEYYTKNHCLKPQINKINFIWFLAWIFRLHLGYYILSEIQFFWRVLSEITNIINGNTKGKRKYLLSRFEKNVWVPDNDWP